MHAMAACVIQVAAWCCRSALSFQRMRRASLHLAQKRCRADFGSSFGKVVSWQTVMYSVMRCDCDSAACHAGYCVILQSRFEDPADAQGIIARGPEALQSQFSSGFGMVLNLLHTRTMDDARAFVQRSFNNFLGGWNTSHLLTGPQILRVLFTMAGVTFLGAGLLPPVCNAPSRCVHVCTCNSIHARFPLSTQEHSGLSHALAGHVRHL